MNRIKLRKTAEMYTLNNKCNLKKQAMKFSAIFVLLMTIGLMSCEAPTEVQDGRFYEIILKNTSSSPVSGATVSIQTQDRYYVVTSDGKGKAQFFIPNEVVLPPFVIVTADHPSIMPEARTVPGGYDTQRTQTITCQPAPLASNTLVREPALHHIGDDNYQGAANSQLQILSEGIRLSFGFHLNGIPARMPKIRFFARGIQRRTKIQINGITVTTLGNSASSGDLSLYSFLLTANPATVFRAGNNFLTIETVYTTSNDDWDDIEFSSLLLYFD